MSTSNSARRWRTAFVIDAFLSLGAGVFWTLAPATFVRSTFGTSAPDSAHVLLAIKGGLPLFLLAGVFYLLLLSSTSLETLVFRRWQQVLMAQDLVYIALGVHMYGVSSGGDASSAALGQVAVAVVRMGLRLGYLFAFVAERQPSPVPAEVRADGA